MRMIDFGKLREVKWFEYAIRFVGGGLISLIAALMDKKYGHVVGGAFLAFPAILPASLTLTCEKDGTGAGMQHEWGAYFGGLGLMAFAAVVWGLAGFGAWALLCGLAAWAITAFAGVSLAIARSRTQKSQATGSPAAEILVEVRRK